MDRLDYIKFARTFSYDISINKSKNHAFLSLIGLWDKTAPVEYYLEDLKTALKELDPGFSIFIDLTQYRGSSPEFFQLHIDALHCIFEAGPSNTLVIQPENPMLKVTFEYMVKLSGLEVSYFSNLSSAEKLLESREHSL